MSSQDTSAMNKPMVSARQNATGKVLHVCPLILAGGRSRRMGRDKAQLRLPSGETLLQRTETLLRQLSAPPGVHWLSPLISGDRPGGLADAVPDCGPLGGLHAAAEHLQRQNIHCDALLAVPVDMPLLQPAQLEQLCTEGHARATLALCYEGCYLPLWLRLDDRSRTYLNDVVAGHEPRAVHRLLENLDGHMLPRPPGDWHRNLNTLSEFAELARSPGHIPR